LQRPAKKNKKAIMKNVPFSGPRRHFLKASGLAAGAAAAPLIIPSRLLGKDAPSNKINLGFIGMGSQGTGRNMGTFLHEDDAIVRAVCDVKLSAANNAKKMVDQKYGHTDCATYQDYRDVIAREDLDAIVISTPDHWHVPLSMAALHAGKDVFSEKPSLTITEGRALVNEVKKRQAVFQWGIEDRSLIKYYRLAGWARSGAIGTLKTIHVTLAHKPAIALDEPAAIPTDLDWNMWLGPAPYRPYTSTIIGPQNWRNVTDFSGGSLTDWGAHIVDTAQIGARMEHSGPIEVSGTCEQFDSKKFQSNTPINYKLHYRYANGVDMLVDDGNVNIKFVGSDGWVQCSGWNGTWTASDPKILHIKEFGDEANYWPRPEIEHRDFLDSMKSRKPPAYHVEAGHRLSSTLHLGHEALRSGRTITWDPATERFGADSTESTKSIVYKRPARDWAKA
jgi:predicted dehydrogenase